MRVPRTNRALTIVRCIGIITCAALILTGTPLTRAVHAQTQMVIVRSKAKWRSAK